MAMSAVRWVTGPRRKRRRVELEPARQLQTVRSLMRIRWFAHAWAVVQVATFYLPYPAGALPVAIAIVALGIAGNAALGVVVPRTRAAADIRRLALVSMGVDGVVIMGLVFVYTFDPDTAIWATLYILPLGAAALFQLRGALWTMAAITVVYTVREIYGHAAYDNEFLPVSISFRMGVGFVIAGFAGAMASGLVSRLGELRVLNRITHTVASRRDLQAALDVVCAEIVTVVDARTAAIALVDSERQSLTVVASSAPDAEDAVLRQRRFSVAASAALQQLLGGSAPLFVTGPGDPSAGAEIAGLLDTRGGRGVLLVPLPARSTTIGAIVLECPEPGEGFESGDVSLAETVAGQIAGAIENTRLLDELVEYVEQVNLVTGAASEVEAGSFQVDSLDGVAERSDALGQLARVFQTMAKEVAAREQRLRKEVQQLRIEIDEQRSAEQVEEITESEYFQRLQSKVDELRIDSAG